MRSIPDRRVVLLLALLAVALLAGYEARAASSAAVSRPGACRALSLPASGTPVERTWTCSSTSDEPDDAMDDTEDPADPQMVEGALLKSVQAGHCEASNPSRTWSLNPAAPPYELRAPVLRRRIFKKP